MGENQEQLQTAWKQNAFSGDVTLFVHFALCSQHESEAVGFSPTITKVQN